MTAGKSQKAASIAGRNMGFLSEDLPNRDTANSGREATSSLQLRCRRGRFSHPASPPFRGRHGPRRSRYKERASKEPPATPATWVIKVVRLKHLRYHLEATGVSSAIRCVAGVAQLVERQPSKLNVDGSNPFTRFVKILNVAVSFLRAALRIENADRRSLSGLRRSAFWSRPSQGRGRLVTVDQTRFGSEISLPEKSK